MRAIGIVIADDHEVVRRGLRMCLSVDDAFEVVGEAENGKAGLQLPGRSVAMSCSWTC